MRNITRILIGFLILNNLSGYSQDTLENKTLKELDNLALKYLKKGDTIKSRTYANYLIAKAKLTKDTIKIANAFYSHTLSKNSREAIIYADSMIYYTQNIDSKYYPAFGYFMKAESYYRAKEFDISLVEALVADSIAKSRNNTRLRLSIKQFMGRLYSHLGKYEEALQIHKEYYNQKLIDGWKSEKDIARALFNISLSYMKVKKRDSARYFWNLSAQKSREIGYDDFYEEKLASIHSQIDFYDGKYERALDTLDKYKKKSTGNWLANNFYYSGKIHQLQKRNELAINDLLLMDSLLITGERPFYHAKDGYALLASIYKQEGNAEKHLKYINKYLAIDSILTLDREIMDPLMLNKYMKPMLLAEKKQLLRDLSGKQNSLNYSFIALAIFVILLIILFIRQRNLSKRIRLLIEIGVDDSKASIKGESKNIKNISHEVNDSIGEQLQEFEKQEGFLEISLSQADLAKSFNTNSSYLSKYINDKLGKNFPSYIKTLRIQYAVKKLKEEPELLKYNIKGMAEKFGFQSADAFSRAFQKETNVKPSQYIKELMKNNNR